MPDAELFRDLYRDSYPHVLAYATSLVGQQAGEDIASETFAVAWRRFAQVRPMTLPWLLGVARNLIHELRRRDARQYELAVAEGLRISTHAAAEDHAEDVAERLAVLGALACLSDADRELLTLMAWQGLTVPEAAQVLGCSAAALSVRLHRARRRLERALESPKEPRARRAGETRDRAAPRNVPKPRKERQAQAGSSGPEHDGAAKAPAISAGPRRLLSITKGAEGA